MLLDPTIAAAIVAQIAPIAENFTLYQCHHIIFGGLKEQYYYMDFNICSVIFLEATL